MLLEDAAEDILAHRHFPTEHRAGSTAAIHWSA
jgi:hypothetical protein